MTAIEGFVPLASYDDENRSRQSGHSPQWKILREAIDDGRVEGYQHGGSKRWLVNKAQADKFLERSIQQSPPPADFRATQERRIAELLADNNALLAAILDALREQARRVDQPQWHPAEDEVGA